MPDLFVAKNFGVFFKNKPILENLHFNIGESDLVFLLGPNGSGKTTLLKNFIRLADNFRCSGSLCFKDQPLAKFSRLRLAALISYVPQSGRTLPPFTVQEFLETGLYAQKKTKMMPNVVEVISETLDRLRISHLRSIPLNQLSGGEKQLVLIASALAQKTKVILLDEPETYLDPVHILRLRQLIMDLHAENICVITVTHNISFPLQINCKILLLKKGRMFFYGKSTELAEKLQTLNETFECNFHFIRHPLSGRPVAYYE